MATVQQLFEKKLFSKFPTRLGCHLPFIDYDKEKLLSIHQKNESNYIWYHEHNKQILNKRGFHYKFLSHEFLDEEPYIKDLTFEVRKKIPILKNVNFIYQFVKFDKDFKLAVHTDSGRNAAIFFPLTDDSAATDFYRGNTKIKSFEHVSPLLLSVNVPHGSDIKSEKITFQMGFFTTGWDDLYDYCSRS